MKTITEPTQHKRPVRLFLTYDGRASGGDTDRAMVLVTSDSLEEAIEARKYFSRDAVTYSYATGGKYLTDERLEIASGGKVVGK